VGCIFNSVGLIITREIPCIYVTHCIVIDSTEIDGAQPLHEIQEVLSRETARPPKTCKNLFSRYCIGTVPAPSSTKTTRLLKEHTPKNKEADKKTVDQQIIEMLWTIRKPPNEETTFGQLVAHEMAQIKDVVTKLLRKRSRWRKNPVLSPSRARKLARSRLPQPRPPNPPRNPCFFRPTIPGLRAEQSSPPPQPRVNGRAQPPSQQKDRAEPAELIPIPLSIPINHLTLLAPAPNRLPIKPPTPLPTPDFRPVRSPSERTSPVSGPFAPLVSEPGHPAHPLSPARSLP
jgi:hypothetical protein